MSRMTSNVLKICAILFMIIDHIGYYFKPNIPSTQVYILLRTIGRAAMPIFCFLIAQGFIHTSNKKKYFFRLFILALLTHISLKILEYFAKVYFINSVNLAYKDLNIVYSFAISVLLLSILEFKIKTKDLTYKVIITILKILIMMCILVCYNFINIDYSIAVPTMIIGIYLIEKSIVKTKKLLGRIIICILIFLICIINQKQIGIFSFISFPLILFYNDKLGKKSKIVQYMFYITFLLQHIVLYLLSMIINN